MRLLIAGPGHRTRAVRRCSLLGVVLLGVVACSGDGADEPGDGSEEPRAPEAAAEPAGAPDLACGDELPCTWDEADEGVLAATMAMGDELAARIADMDGALEWLAGQDGVVEATADARGIRVRLDGGRPVWVLTPDAYADLPDASVAPPHSGADDPEAGDGPPVDEAEADEVGHAPLAQPIAVVGENPGSKSALALSPHSQEWIVEYTVDGQTAVHDWNDARLVADILSGTRDYEGNVTYVDETGIALGSFTGWDAYDVVMVSTHGIQHCSPMCTTVLDTGIVAELDETDALWHTPGIDLVRHGADRAGTWSIGVATDFFRAAYPGGLDETLVLLSACETAAGNDLVGHLAGDSSVVLGWSATVMADSATNASVALFDELSQHGSTTGEAMEVLRDRGLGVGQATVPTDGLVVYELIDGEWVRDGQEPEQRVDGASFRRHQGGDDLRVREVVELQNPHNGTMLTGGEHILVERRGDADHLPVRIEVDGVPEGEEAGFTVTLELDHADDTSWALDASEVQRVDAHTVRIVDELALHVPVEDVDEIAMRATVDLPEGGHSVHEVTVRPTAELTLHWDVEWIGHVPESVVGQSSDTLAASAVVPLDAEVDGGRTVFSGSGPLDVVAAPEVCPGVVESPELVVERLVFDLEATTGELRFDWPAADRPDVWPGDNPAAQGGVSISCLGVEVLWTGTRLHAAGDDMGTLVNGIVDASWMPGSGESVLDYRMHFNFGQEYPTDLWLHVRLVPGHPDAGPPPDA